MKQWLADRYWSQFDHYLVVPLSILYNTKMKAKNKRILSLHKKYYKFNKSHLFVVNVRNGISKIVKIFTKQMDLRFCFFSIT